jgi:hypothetical protein
MELIKVVVRYLDGRVLKGYTYDFFPNKSVFHLYPLGEEKSGAGLEIQIKDLKSVFFVRDFEGNRDYNEEKEFSPSEKYHGRKVEVVFEDGEALVGTTMGYAPERPGFFLSPADPRSNNLRVFVVNKAVRQVRNV